MDTSTKKQESISKISIKNSFDEYLSNIKKYGSSNNASAASIQINKKPSDKISYAFSNDLSDKTTTNNGNKKENNENEKSIHNDNDNKNNDKKSDKNTEITADSDADFYTFFENVPENIPWIDSNVATHASASAKLLKSVFGEPSAGTDSMKDNKSSFQSVGKMLDLFIIQYLLS